MLAPVVNILPLTTIQKIRVLPVPGKVVVRIGQKVAPRDVIAEAQMAPKHLLLNIARSLRVSTDEADKLIQRKEGELLHQGDLVAGPVGIPRRVVRAPADGEVILAGDGQVLLELKTRPFELRAGMSGKISEIIPRYGAVVETTGAIIQGVWGNGHTDFGLMQSKIQAPEADLLPEQIDVSLRGTVVLGGHCQDQDVFHKAADVPLRGLIVASMPSHLIPLAEKMEFPILVLEGFGDLSMNPISYNLLTTNDNREVSINAEPMDPITGHRPEAIIPLPSSQELSPPMSIEEFAAGQQVRVTRAPYQAQTGTIKMLYNELLEFPSGIQARGARVNLRNGQSVDVPLANLEVIA